ncbi:MAG: sugar ABC transporter substrate-binding protein [Anaerolineales bacterium]|nr:sugar ABC transporter substrate-binding protein [Anaerolineales bacterium]
MFCALALILAGCAAPTAAPTSAPAPTAAVAPTTAPAAGGFQLAQRIVDKIKAGEKLVIRVSYHDVSNEFAPQIKTGVDKAAAALGVDAVMIGPTGADADKQIAELESLIDAGKLDGLAISSVSTDALAPIIDKALAAGIPVITFNTDNPASERLAFVGQDLIGSGRIAGDLMAKVLGEQGKVIITTLDAAAQWSLDRESGAREALAKYPGITVVATINTGTEPNAIYTAIENAMLANPDVNGILSMECCSLPAAGDWASRNEQSGKVKIVGFDFLPKTMQYVKDGTIAATIGQGPETQGYKAVELTLDALNGKAVANIDTGAEVVDGTNIDKYLGAAGGFQLAQRIVDKIKAGEKLVIRVSYHDVSNEFAPQIKTGVDKAAAALGVDAVMIGPTGADADKQIAELESLIDAGKLDGLAISSVSTDALAPIIDKALAAGIPVITFNTDNPASERLAFVGQDLIGSGRIAGDLMAKVLGEQGKVIITTLDAAAQWSLDRESGAREALAKYPGITVVATINTGTEPNAIYTAIENAMLANPDVNGILSMECCSLPAAGDWASRNEQSGKVKIVGFDFLPKTMQYVKDGTIAATIGQGPETQGYKAVELVLDALNGKAVANVDTGAEVVDDTNIDNYLK